ncbi:DNA-directed DNA polymerase II small subunit [Halalkalicoccus jeotgali]|uniref:DNA polymerase II small subunit n=1 Tax=Halalkalicoccus jeotgali (strain DSM 18796 / CECT 7217 / JCM 14584 / KCTC 4019 / B3) TaxID=795797 RepID=D8J4G6_HALJB|nr:DNA-directed DNA polymerase II small subunit [Halalkalicoccus jeotgali]ADJ13528.1 DNA-directed DNA polymerase [Halalkalicoccus jeotgali B3]ELY32997.1 DNA polymerase II small subunit [Halalkalicoccus jeotgali B3]
MAEETDRRIVAELAARGYNADREAITLIAGTPDPEDAIERAVETVSADALKVTGEQLRGLFEDERRDASPRRDANDSPSRASNPPVSPAKTDDEATNSAETVPVEAEVDTSAMGDGRVPVESGRQLVEILGDITGQSTGTGEYSDFVTVFRDRYERLAGKLRRRVNHRPADAIQSMPGGGNAEMIGMVNDIRSTASGHWLIELEDTTGVFPCLVMKDREIADLVNELVYDEVIAVRGTLADDAGILFTDEIFFPDVPHTHKPNTADRHVQAALISDVHVGSQEFAADAWSRFADWLHTEEAQSVEYLLLAGDMVEGVGVYPNQDEELSIIDIYEQYEAFAEYLKEVPGDLEIVMIPGNHDAVRLAEPQPAFDEELREIMSAHDARITGNPSTVTIEGVSVLMYHGMSLDEIIADLPEEKASYDDPQKAMYHLLKKRHVAPKYGGKMRIAPEERDYLVIDEVPDVFHTGHVHKLGFGTYHNVTAINSGCWQEQTAFQKSVNIDPDVGYAPIVDLDTLDVTARKFT